MTLFTIICQKINNGRKTSIVHDSISSQCVSGGKRVIALRTTCNHNLTIINIYLYRKDLDLKQIGLNLCKTFYEIIQSFSNK